MGFVCVLSYFATGEGEKEKEETSNNFITFNCVTGLHVITLKRWSKKSSNIVNIVIEEEVSARQLF